jgi:hypothetical protein
MAANAAQSAHGRLPRRRRTWRSSGCWASSSAWPGPAAVSWPRRRRRRPTPSPGMAAASTDTGHARDYVAIANRWARDVVGRPVVACQLTKAGLQAPPRGSEARQGDKAWGYVFDPWHGNDVCDFIEKLPHVKGVVGDPTIVPRAGADLHPGGHLRLASPRTASAASRWPTSRWPGRAPSRPSPPSSASTACAARTRSGPEIYVGATTGAQALKVFGPMLQMAGETP